LSFGSPLGWLLLQLLQGQTLVAQLTDHRGLYLYMCIGTLVTFGCFGWYVGLNEQKRKELSIKDALTQCFNFRYFHLRFEEELHRAQRSEQVLSLLILDIDKFKLVNDTYGHPVGDKVLINTAHTVAHNLRSYEVLCRIGGEEFAILALQSPLDDALEIAHRIKDRVKSSTLELENGTAIQVTISIGVATYTKGDNIDSMLSRADKALYEAKENGRDCVVAG
jgi:diguanylate cyclase (GGDEF)-like protein